MLWGQTHLWLVLAVILALGCTHKTSAQEEDYDGDGYDEDGYDYDEKPSLLKCCPLDQILKSKEGNCVADGRSSWVIDANLSETYEVETGLPSCSQPDEYLYTGNISLSDITNAIDKDDGSLHFQELRMKSGFFCLDMVETEDGGKVTAVTCPKPTKDVLKKIHKCCPHGEAFENNLVESCSIENYQNHPIPIDGHLVELKDLEYNTTQAHVNNNRTCPNGMEYAIQNLDDESDWKIGADGKLRAYNTIIPDYCVDVFTEDDESRIYVHNCLPLPVRIPRCCKDDQVIDMRIGTCVPDESQGSNDRFQQAIKNKSEIEDVITGKLTIMNWKNPHLGMTESGKSCEWKILNNGTLKYRKDNQTDGWHYKEHHEYCLELVIPYCQSHIPAGDLEVYPFANASLDDPVFNENVSAGCPISWRSIFQRISQLFTWSW